MVILPFRLAAGKFRLSCVVVNGTEQLMAPYMYHYILYFIILRYCYELVALEVHAFFQVINFNVKIQFRTMTD